MVKKAVVFDNSGTLLKRCRAVKNMSNGKISEEISSLELVDGIKDSILVVLQTDMKKCLMTANPEKKLYDFIKKYEIPIDISYSSVDFRKEDILPLLKNSEVKLSDFHETAYYLSERNNFIQLCSGSAFILNTITNNIDYIVTAGGKVFPKVSEVIETLIKRKIKPFIASGDGFESLHELAEIIKLPKENVFETASTRRKKEIVKELKKEYKVMMVGNGPNDILAFEEADLAVLTLEQKEMIPQKVFNSADIVIDHIFEVLDINF